MLQHPNFVKEIMDVFLQMRSRVRRQFTQPSAIVTPEGGNRTMELSPCSCTSALGATSDSGDSALSGYIVDDNAVQQ